MHRWYAYDGIIGGRIDQVLGALRIIDEKDAKIHFLLQPTKTKAFWPTKSGALFKPLLDKFDIDVQPQAMESSRAGSPNRIYPFRPRLPARQFRRL